MKSFKIIIPYLFLSFLIFIVRCKKDEVKPTIFNQTGIVISEDTLSFTENEINKSISLTSKGTSNVAFEVTSYPEWLTISPLSGVLNQNIVKLNISINEKVALGYNSGEIIIFSNQGTKKIKVFKYYDNTVLVSVPDSIIISPFENMKNLTLSNSGNNLIAFSLNVSNSNILINESSGVIVSKSTKSISINFNRDTMKKELYYSEISLTLNNQIKKIKVKIENKIENKQILNYDILDAEFSKLKNVLVYVASNSNKLFIYDTQTELTSSIDLNYAPICVSISQNGKEAVIGHDGHVSHVNLETKTLFNDFDVSCEAIDIVLGTNNWAYVFPKRDQWAYIRCIKLDNPQNTEVKHKGSQIYAGTLAKLHPSGKYIYGADNGLSPSDIERYDIQKDTAYFIMDSPYHGDYAMNGNLWFSEDGNRIFTKGGNVFKTSSNTSLDMLYNGKITIQDSNPYGNFIKWLDHSSAMGNIYLVAYGEYNKPIQPYLYIYNSSNLIFKKRVDLEKYYIPDGQGGGKVCNSEPHFVFSNSTGNSVFILSKAVNSGLEKEWSLQKIIIN